MGKWISREEEKNAKMMWGWVGAVGGWVRKDALDVTVASPARLRDTLTSPTKMDVGTISLRIREIKYELNIGIGSLKLIKHTTNPRQVGHLNF